MTSKLRRRLVGVGLATAAATAIGTSIGSTASAAEGQVLGLGAPNAVAGSFIVTLKPGVAVESAAKDLASRHSGTIGRQYTAALKGFSVRASEASAKKIAGDSRVAKVSVNRIHRISDTQNNPPSWGLDRVDQRNLPLDSKYTYPTTASNVTTYIIDTGVAKAHATFGGRARDGYDAIDNDNTAQDGHGHGTHVAGTVAGAEYGLAKGAAVVGVRVLDNSGSGTTEQVVAGIDWVTSNAVKPAVANMSLGGGADQPLDDAVKRSIDAGITYAVAAGNDNQNACNYSPARTPAAITVGSTTSSDARSSFSNFGTCVDIFAPGSSIVSANKNGGSTTMSGTSMASPHVAGAAALVLAANPSYTPQQVRDALVTNATDGKVTSPGTGSPNKLLFVGTGGDPGPGPGPGCTQKNDTDVAIPDLATVESSVTVSGCAGNGSASSTVAVKIKHTYKGDLVVSLIAPDGTAHVLHNRAGGGADDIDQTFTVNLTSEVRNGTWKLRVRDAARIDTGTLDTWTLTV